MRHQFPMRRALLSDHHRLPSIKLRAFSDALIPRPGEDPYARVEVFPNVWMELDLRSVVQRSIAYGLYDRAELAVMDILLRPGDTVFDVGANVGLYTVVASHLVSDTGTVHAFEPDPRAVRRLRANINLNRATNVVIHEVALAERSGRSELRNPGYGDSLNETAFSTLTQRGTRVAHVSVETLDSIIADYRVSEIALLKIDAEGADARVLRGGQRSLASGRVKRVIVEVLNGDTAVQEILAGLDFSLAVVRSSVSNTPLTRKCTAQDRFEYTNILCTLPARR
jgi:FkbM family methyltransferase